MKGVLKLDGISFAKGEEINDKHLEILQNWKKVSILLSDTIDQLRTARTNAIKDKNRHKSLLIKYKNNYEQCKKQLDKSLLKNEQMQQLADQGKHYHEYCDKISSIAVSMKDSLDQVKDRHQKIDTLEQKLNEAEKEYQSINHQDIKNHHNLALSQKKASYILSLIQKIDEHKAETESLILKYHNLKEELMGFNSDTNQSLQIIFEQLNEFNLINKSDKVALNAVTLSNNLSVLINENINDNNYANSDEETEIDDCSKNDIDSFELLQSQINSGLVNLEPGDKISDQENDSEDIQSEDSDYYKEDLIKTSDLVVELSNNRTVANILDQVESKL